MFSLEQYRAVSDSAGFLDRSARGRLRLTGRDRRDYLQGLLTNDIAALTPGTGCYAALLTAQGRMIADMYVIETGEHVLIDVEPDVTDRIAAHLERFIFSEDVQVANDTATTSQIGVIGQAAATVLEKVLGQDVLRAADLEAMRPLDNRSFAWRGQPAIVVRRDDMGLAGFDVIVAAGNAAALSDRVRAAGVHAIDGDVAEVLRVESGVPRFGIDMSEDTIPLEAGIEDRAISPTKGCYVGQEIIIRVLHRGHGRVARRLVGLRVDGRAVPRRGDRIRVGEREVGAVTSAVWSPAADGPLALGYVHRDFAAVGAQVSIVIQEAPTPAVVTPLPVAPQPAPAAPQPPVPR
jgi:folate-binding protein YgfZ